MSAAVLPNGTILQLDSHAEPNEQVEPGDVTEPTRLVRLLMRILRDVALLRRRWWPLSVDHRDRVVDATGTLVHRFPHGFGGRVNWWPVDWTGAAGPQLARHASTDENTLVLVSYVAGTVTLHVEAAG